MIEIIAWIILILISFSISRDFKKIKTWKTKKLCIDLILSTIVLTITLIYLIGKL